MKSEVQRLTCHDVCARLSGPKVVIIRKNFRKRFIGRGSNVGGRETKRPIGETPRRAVISIMRHVQSTGRSHKKNWGKRNRPEERKHETGQKQATETNTHKRKEKKEQRQINRERDRSTKNGSPKTKRARRDQESQRQATQERQEKRRDTNKTRHHTNAGEDRQGQSIALGKPFGE